MGARRRTAALPGNAAGLTQRRPAADDVDMVTEDRVPAALRHSFAVLDAVAQGGSGGSDVAEISARTQCHPRTVYRHLASLRAMGMIEVAVRSESRYRLGPGIAALARQASDQANFLRSARQFAMETGERTGQPVHVTVFDNGTAVTVASAEPRLSSEAMKPIVLGSRRPAHASASGKIFLANSPSAFRSYITRVLQEFTNRTIVTAEALEEECVAVRERGWATDDEEYILGVTCIAVPVWGANQRVVGTLSVSTPLSESAVLRRKELLGHLRPAAAEFSKSIGGSQPHPEPGAHRRTQAG